uniref:Metallo-beta-lactamase domain-containing protein n=1 Tax=Physcomitrium patens TaxID=3218 RepID=A0A7I4DFZ0_PHYPA
MDNLRLIPSKEMTNAGSLDTGVLSAVGLTTVSTASSCRVELNNSAMEVTQPDGMASVGRSELIVLGSGSSTGVPSPLCVINPTDPPCNVCRMAMEGPHELNPNYRCNPSLLISYLHNDGQRRYIQIDAGKDFKEQVLRWFIPYKIPRLDALILTHEHADAMLGLDNVRGVQPVNFKNDIPPMPVFVTQHTMDSVALKFPYLASKKRKEGEELRRVAQFDWRVIEPSIDTRFQAGGLTFTPLPVYHGEDYICLGFLFGEKTRVAYISDVSRIPTRTEHVISKEQGGQVDLLFVDTNGVGLPGGISHMAAIAKYGAGQVDFLFLDSLYKETPHNTHMTFPESLKVIKKLQPKRAFLIGMTHEFEHDLDSKILAEWSARENPCGIQL